MGYCGYANRVCDEVPLPFGTRFTRSLGTVASTEAAAGLCPGPFDCAQGRLQYDPQSEGIEVRAVHPSTHIVVGQNVSSGGRRCMSFARA